MFNELLLLPPSAKLSLLVIVSLIIGSFLNVVIYRLPLMLEDTWNMRPASKHSTTSQVKPKINLFLPRSYCTACHRTIAALHNIPLFSFLALRGRCHYCHLRISARYPITEALFVSLSLTAAYFFGFSLTLLFAMTFIGITICLFWIDLYHQLLPDSLTLGLLWLGLIANTAHLFVPLQTAVIGAIVAYMTLWLFTQIFYLLTKKVGMGHGDFKLFAAFGAWFGWSVLPSILVLASTSGAIFGYIYLKKTNQPSGSAIPFGPFLVASGVLALFGIIPL